MADQNEQSEPPKTSISRVMTDEGNKAQRLLRVDQIYSRKDRQVHFVKTAKPKAKPDRFSKTAVVVRRIISRQGMVASIEIDIRSETLKEIFLELYDGVENLRLKKNPPIAEPELFFHAKPYLLKKKEEEKAKEHPNQSAINDIGTALRFIDEDFAGQYANLQSLLANGEITYDLLWTIFPPKTVVYIPDHGVLQQRQAMMMTSADYQQDSNGAKYFLVEGRVLTHDGRDFGLGQTSVRIPFFPGAKQVLSMPCYPFMLNNDHEKIRAELIERGRKYVSLIKTPQPQEYGAITAIYENAQAVDNNKLQKFNAFGRVMIDVESFYMNNGSSDLNRPYVYSEHFINDKDSLTEDQFFIAASWINGFSFLRKIWGQFAVAELKDIVWNDRAFQKLVMKEERRELIHALVKAHKQDEESFDDIVQNKGRGLVGLLTGSPGVGKTLTAEAVAEVTRRPLYAVSTGELGIDADEVDRRLDLILEITRRWGCVLLIDEADVFLARRGGDLNRDTLVSIFLRRLEYFRGVLILTTNRSSTIDPAFQSRIHFTTHYPELNVESRKTVWKNFIEMASRSSSKEVTIKDADIDELAKRELNGRQIKNAVSCAVSLAKERKEQLVLKDIINVLDVL